MPYNVHPYKYWYWSQHFPQIIQIVFNLVITFVIFYKEIQNNMAGLFCDLCYDYCEDCIILCDSHVVCDDCYIFVMNVAPWCFNMQNETIDCFLCQLLDLCHWIIYILSNKQYRIVELKVLNNFYCRNSVQ